MKVTFKNYIFISGLGSLGLAILTIGLGFVFGASSLIMLVAFLFWSLICINYISIDKLDTKKEGKP